MPNGKPGDDPLNDIFTHKLEVYGREADELIRKIGQLCSDREMYEWWEREIVCVDDRELVLHKARARHQELLKKGQKTGWDVNDDA